MIEVSRGILLTALERLEREATQWLPSLVAALFIVGFAWAVARIARWTIRKIFRGLAADRFLRRSGIAYAVDRTGRLRATRLAAEGAYWSILLLGLLAGLSVFHSTLTSRAVEGLVLLLPRLVIAALMLAAGTWLSQYARRAVLVWAVREGLPSPRWLAAAARAITLFVCVVAATEHLEFAPRVFLAAFVIVGGGVVLAASLAVGLAASSGLRRYFERDTDADSESIFSHRR